MTRLQVSGEHPLMQLLADRATEGLDAAGEQSLKAMLREHPDVSLDELDFAAAALDLAFLSAAESARDEQLFAPMPAELRQRVSSAALPAIAVAAPLRHTGGPRETQAMDRTPRESLSLPSGRRPAPRSAAIAWSLAAVFALLAGAAWLVPGVISPRGGAGTSNTLAVATRAEALAKLAAGAKKVATGAWSPGNDATGAACTGEVLWNAAEQRGYMVFRGLKPNDPKIEQYQLWIFDPERDARFPVHGGVFNVTSTGEVVVPIEPRLGVPKAAVFVVTVERPGGVWVSDRSRVSVKAELAS